MKIFHVRLKKDAPTANIISKAGVFSKDSVSTVLPRFFNPEIMEKIKEVEVPFTLPDDIPVEIVEAPVKPEPRPKEKKVEEKEKEPKKAKPFIKEKLKKGKKR